jgi:hypothetical protein
VIERLPQQVGDGRRGGAGNGRGRDGSGLYMYTI